MRKAGTRTAILVASIASFYAAGCADSATSGSAIPSVVGTQQAQVTTSASTHATSGDNRTGLPAVNLADYPNPWHIALSDEPAVFGSASGAGYVYTAPRANVGLYDSTNLPATTDVNQSLGNSSFMGAMAALADRVPGFLQRGIRYISTNTDGSHNYVVRLFGPTPTDGNLTVIWVPTDDRRLEAPDGSFFGASGPVLWPAIYEKAFAKLVTVTHQGDGQGSTATGYDTQNVGCCTTGYAGLTGMAVETFSNTGGSDANSQAAVGSALAGVNNANVLMSAYLSAFSDISTWPDFNTVTQSVALPNGSTLTEAPNQLDVVYTDTVGVQVELVANMEYPVLATNNDFVLLRNTWGHNGSGDQGYIWMRQPDFLRIFLNAYLARDPGHALGTAAAADLP